jgi:hypothetical protein
MDTDLSANFFAIMGVGVFFGLFQAGVVCAIHRLRLNPRIAGWAVFRNIVVILLMPMGAKYLLELNQVFLFNPTAHFAVAGALGGLLTALVFFKMRDGCRINFPFFAGYSIATGAAIGASYFLFFVRGVNPGIEYGALFVLVFAAVSGAAVGAAQARLTGKIQHVAVSRVSFAISTGRNALAAVFTVLLLQTWFIAGIVESLIGTSFDFLIIYPFLSFLFVFSAFCTALATLKTKDGFDIRPLSFLAYASLAGAALGLLFFLFIFFSGFFSQ